VHNSKKQCCKVNVANDIRANEEFGAYGRAFDILFRQKRKS
jgi:hypothetical protein